MGQSPTVSGLQGAQAPAFPYSQKGGTNVPLLGWHRDRFSGYRLRRMRRLRCFFSPAAPVQAVRLRLTNRKFFEKNLTKNFPRFACPYSIKIERR